VLESKEVTWGIEAPAIFANQVTPVVGLAGDPPVTLPSRTVRKDLASRPDYAHEHGWIRHEPIVNRHHNMSGSFWKDCRMQNEHFHFGAPRSTRPQIPFNI
jgi:hypothetical protein